ncbi:tripartite tricarboxylate transporter substrate binding protein [Achromobacter sp. GG226]|uniref:tripartite tricarboxylate transporter substrate binding protein n=1 Tax=Verticiella alkaliphila TaxID=2779529 RepID=UPI001C0E1506|nr:tripartite tricarboxylate transporter substrate binding protein [Verticiella sp. GG226]MBU4611540.1 tripartite tricarboxylate transporter substrate binding protein [Verticiella sp. GG226]
MPTYSMRLIAASLAAFALAPAMAADAAWPTRPITLMIPYPPGGSADLLARPIAAKLESRLGQPVVLDYRPGAGGSIATASLARAEPDGHTMLMVLAAHAINVSLYPKLPYDTRKDFAPVSLVATLPLLVAAPLATPADSMPAVVQYAKANPGKLTYASAGPGNTSHLAAAMFAQTAGVDMVHIPYKGSGPAVVALLSGEVSLMFDSISTSLPHVKSGKLKALAVTGEARSPLLPDVPTVRESGAADFAVDGWYGIIAPAGTPASAIDRFNSAIREVIAEAPVREQLESYGYAMVGSTPQAFGDHITAEIDRWGEVVQASGAKVE